MDNAKISAAFVAAQKGFAPALKGSTNPHFRSRYADLSACVEAVIDALNSNGIALLQETEPSENGVTVTTRLLHVSGESLTGGSLHVPADKQTPQGYGSALTYARRYSLMATCGIAPEDDDGNAASASAPKKPAPKAADVAKKLGAAKDLPALAKAWASLSPAEKKVGLEAKNLLKSKMEGDEAVDATS